MQICILKRISEELRKGCKSGRKEHLVMSHETGGFSAVGKGGQVDVQIRAVSLVGFQRCGDSTHLIAEIIMMNRIRYHGPTMVSLSAGCSKEPRYIVLAQLIFWPSSFSESTLIFLGSKCNRLNTLFLRFIPPTANNPCLDDFLNFFDSPLLLLGFRKSPYVA